MTTPRIHLGPYEGYRGTARLEEPASYYSWHGKVDHIRDAVPFMASDPEHLEEAFRSAIDDYLEDCRAAGFPPESPAC